MKVMLDTNILVSAFVFNSKKLNELIYKLSIEHEIIICTYTITELNELIKTKFKVSPNSLDQFLEEFPFTLVYSPPNVEHKLFDIRDEDDYIILHTAIIENVDIFITGDKDFDDITIKHPKIMTVNKFLENYSWFQKRSQLAY